MFRKEGRRVRMKAWNKNKPDVRKAGNLLQFSDFICFLIFFFLSFFLIFPINAWVAEDEIWTGWTVFESGSEGWYQTGGDGGHAYGRYQFDIGYDFTNFMRECVSADSEGYAGFNKFIAMSRITAGRNGNAKIMENKPLLEARSELSEVWKRICNEQGEDFFNLQTDFASGVYYYPVKSKLMAVYGINLDDYGPALKGTVWSIAVRDGSNVSRNQEQNNLRAVTGTYRSGIDEREWLNLIYDAETERHKSQSQRWNIEQRAAALDVLNGGSGEIYMVSGRGMGSLGISFASDGSEYVDYVSEWIKGHKELSRGFVESGCWSESNKEWVYALRGVEEGGYDFYDMYGISGGGVLGGFIDFGGGVSGGIWISGEGINAETKHIPDNDSNNGVVYFGQSNSAGGSEWASVRFGGKNIGSSGCSVTSLAMVISYLRSGSSADGWVYPSDVVKMIADRNGGNYNKFYSGDAGQSWDIFPAVAGYYGIKCSQISSSSIINSLVQGRPVIMSCKPGEFTSKGHFIVITGIDADGYCYVNDPSHSDKSYKKYTASYLASQGKGWWSFSK